MGRSEAKGSRALKGADTPTAAHQAPSDELLRFSRAISFQLELEMSESEALAFVRDVPRSLAHADFITDLRLRHGSPPSVSASLPVSAALFGRRELPFESEIHHQPAGASLRPLPLSGESRGWVELAGEVDVAANGSGSRASYAFEVTAHLRLPIADRWGTRALTKMIELTAASLLRDLVARLPAAIERAANEQ